MPSAQPPIHRRERPRHLINILYAVERDARACERSSSSLDLWIHGEDTLGHQPSTNLRGELVTRVQIPATAHQSLSPLPVPVCLCVCLRDCDWLRESALVCMWKKARMH